MRWSSSVAKNSWWKNKLSLIVDGTKKLNGSHERQGKQAVHAELKALHANLMKGRQRDTMYSESVYTIHVCIQDSQIGGTPLIFFGDLYHNGALSSCLFDRMTYMVYMYIHTYVVLLLQPLLPCKLHHDPWLASSGYRVVCSYYMRTCLT